VDGDVGVEDGGGEGQVRMREWVWRSLGLSVDDEICLVSKMFLGMGEREGRKERDRGGLWIFIGRWTEC
jgi:hypothetical protein